MRSMQGTPTRDRPPNRIREVREARGLRQAHLAAFLDVDQSTIARWERNDSAIPDPAKLRLAEFLGVAPAYLMGWAEEPVAA